MSTFVKVQVRYSKKFAVTKELSMTKIKKIILTKNLYIYSVFHAWVSYGHINSVPVTIIKSIIIRSKFFFLFIGWQPTTWPANNCPQIVVCSCAMPFNCVWLGIIIILHIRKRKPCFSPSCDRSCVKMADGFTSRGYSLKKQTRCLNDKTIIELGYRKISWFISISQINYLPQPLASVIDLLATDKSRYFAQPRPIIVNYFVIIILCCL